VSIKDQLSIIQSRLRDYNTADIVAQRNELVRRWRAAHPEAANEVSASFHPLICTFKTEPAKKDPPTKLPDEHWASDVYSVTVRRWHNDRVFGSDGGMVQIGISCLDGTARHDWRDFQQIKNQIAGPECEAFELYPAESRVVDPSNYYTLWCFPGIKRLKIGIDEREVRDADEALAPQRAFAPPNDSEVAR